VKNNFNAVVTIAARDITKLFRDRFRILASFIFPIIFIGVLGSSLQANLQNNLPYNYLTFVFLGALAQTLFQSTASGIISLVEDRQNDFAQEMFIAPISRYAIIFGKILGETIVSFILTLGIILFGLIIRIPLDFAALLRLLPFALIVSLFGGAFGLIVMANVKDQKTVNQLFPFLMFPQFFLAGVFNPIKVLPLPLLIASRIAPMTYAVDLIRSVYYSGSSVFRYTVLFNPVLNLVVVTAVFFVFFSLGTILFVRNEKNR
jgi:ABC-2 type transport system permease protein